MNKINHDDTVKTRLDITGIHCAPYASGIETFLKSQEGGKMAKVDYDERRHASDIRTMLMSMYYGDKWKIGDTA